MKKPMRRALLIAQPATGSCPGDTRPNGRLRCESAVFIEDYEGERCRKYAAHEMWGANICGDHLNAWLDRGFGITTRDGQMYRIEPLGPRAEKRGAK